MSVTPEIDPSDWDDFIAGGSPSALSEQTTGHHETWNTQSNPLWQTLRSLGEKYREDNRIIEPEVKPTMVEDFQPVKTAKRGDILRYVPGGYEANSLGAEMLVEVISKRPASGQVRVKRLGGEGRPMRAYLKCLYAVSNGI